VEYSDGTTGCGLPVDYLLNVLRCNTILFVLNRLAIDRKPGAPWQERLLTHVVSRNYSPAFRATHLNRRLPVNRALEFIREHQESNSNNIMNSIAPEVMPIGNLCIDSFKLKAVAEKAISQTLAIFNAVESRSQGLASKSNIAMT
jgi:hypothetical protein